MLTQLIFVNVFLMTVASTLDLNDNLPSHYCQCLDEYNVVLLPGCGVNSNWSKFDVTSSTWRTFENWTAKELDDNYEVVADGTLQIIGASRTKDGSLYRCSNQTSTTYTNATLFSVCYCGTPTVLQPAYKNLTRQNLHGDTRQFTCEAIIGPCVHQSQCLTSTGHVTWTYRSDQSNVAEQSVHYVQDSTRTRINTTVHTKKDGDVVVHSTYTIENIGEEDYGNYSCNITNGRGDYVVRTIRLEYGLSQNAIEETAPKWHLYLAVSVVAASVVSIVVAGVVYYYLLDFRLRWYLTFGGVGLGEFQYPVLLITTDSRADVRFVEDEFMPKAMREVGYQLNVVYPPRDFYVGNNEMNFLDSMRQSRRLVFLITDDFLTEQTYHRVFVDALGLNRWPDLVFIVKDVSPTSWTQENNMLKRTLDKCSTWHWSRVQKLVWGRERRLPGFDIARWQEKRFWTKFRLAMPRMDPENQIQNEDQNRIV